MLTTRLDNIRATQATCITHQARTETIRKALIYPFRVSDTEGGSGCVALILTHHNGEPLMSCGEAYCLSAFI